METTLEENGNGSGNVSSEQISPSSQQINVLISNSNPLQQQQVIFLFN